jgi:hypothetical protein
MTATLAEPTTVPVSLAGDLLLVRLLPPTRRAPAPARVRADVARFFGNAPSDECWQETVDGLVHAGLLATKPWRLTEAGRRRALDFLGTRELPPRCNWGTIQAKFLVPKALGLAPTAPETVKRIANEEGLAAVLLKRRFELGLGPSPSLGAVLEALACRELGFPEASSLVEVKRRVLARLIGSDEGLSDDALKKTLPRVLLGARSGGIRGLRGALLQAWADATAPRQAPAPPTAKRASDVVVQEPSSADFDLPAFARTVKAAARHCPTGRFGDNKVFISHVWRHLREEPGFPAMDLPTFKERLTEANNARLLTLSRADLVQVMNPADVQESQTRYLTGEFHFVLVEKEQP